MVAALEAAATDVALNDSIPVLIDGAGVDAAAAAAAVAGIGGELGCGAGSGSAGGATARLKDLETVVLDGQAPGEL